MIAVAKPQADRLERWALFLRCFKYQVFHIDGDSNVWADMLSRWGAGTFVANDAEAESKEGEVVTAERAAQATLTVRCDRVLLDQAHSAARRQTNENIMGEDDERWPSKEEILVAQDDLEPQVVIDIQLVSRDGLLVDTRGRIFILDEPKHLRARLMVIAQARAAGHRGQEQQPEIAGRHAHHIDKYEAGTGQKTDHAGIDQ